LIDQVALSRCTVKTDIPGLDIVPATQDLSGAEVELVAVDDRTSRLTEALTSQHDPSFTGYDICFIDCPPSLGLLTLNALCAADTLMVPLQCEFFALEGLSQLLQTVERVQERFNPDLGIVGVALTMFDRRNRLTDQVADDVRDCLGDLVFENVIPRNVRLSEAPSHGMPALVYDHNCPGSRAYIGLARELIGRLPEMKGFRSDGTTIGHGRIERDFIARPRFLRQSWAGYHQKRKYERRRKGASKCHFGSVKVHIRTSW